jgi:oligopeptidase B
MVMATSEKYLAGVQDDGALEPPVAPRRPTVHEAHGVTRADDYAWLRDMDDPQALGYLRAERDHYERATEHLSSLREELADEMVSRTPAADSSVRWRRGALVYYTRARRGEEYERLFRLDPRTDESTLVLDPNSLADDSGHLGLGVVEPSPDGRLVAYSVDRTGQEVFELRFREVDTGRDLPDVVERTYYGGAWSADSSTFFYPVPDAAHRPDRVLRHRLGTDAAQDPGVLVEPDRRFELTVEGSRDGHWVILAAASRDTTEVHLVSAASGTG